ncbi:MAG: PIG-L family deacetylase [Spirochaetaceae bacterium]|nr:MAG: PIG-L family deacetylase [Spirochaetaceae bacterium]
MQELAITYRLLLFVPLIAAVILSFGALLMRVIRLARYPGFGGRYDRELRFPPRGPALIAAAVAALCVLAPAVIGIRLHYASAQRSAEYADVSSGSVVLQEGGSAVTPALPPPVTTAPQPRGDAVTTAPDPSVPGTRFSDAPPPPAWDADRRDLVPLDPVTHRYRHTRRIDPDAVWAGSWPDALAEVDVLFVHAHPDDESLDFAVLMAALARQGATIATLLLTDGESGLDRFPHRAEHPGYASRRLSGEELRLVRIQEARRALSILGSDYYIRLGLPNHPYNGISDELTLEQVLTAWGGEQALVSVLRDVLHAVRPRLVVAPDGPSQAREHFEHEATGYLVRRTVNEALSEGWGPDGYLVSVDPFQRQFYPEAIAIPSAPRGEDLRGVQRAALSQHHTQADASVIGVRRLGDLPWEYYQSVFWYGEHSLGSLIGARERIVARE